MFDKSMIMSVLEIYINDFIYMSLKQTSVKIVIEHYV